MKRFVQPSTSTGVDRRGLQASSITKRSGKLAILICRQWVAPMNGMACIHIMKSVRAVTLGSAQITSRVSPLKLPRPEAQLPHGTEWRPSGSRENEAESSHAHTTHQNAKKAAKPVIRTCQTVLSMTCLTISYFMRCLVIESLRSKTGYL